MAPIRIEGRKSNTAGRLKTNHRCNRPTAYWARPKDESKDQPAAVNNYSHTEHVQASTWL